MKKISCSVLLICQNAENSIKRCLSSLADFSEVVLVDGGSVDNTLMIARTYENVVIYENPWPGFIEQRNFSVSKATEKWSFMIDSDEKMTVELVNEIRNITQSEKPAYPMYSVVRTEYFLGKPVEHGFGASDWQERLFITNRVSYTGGVHHEHLIDGAHQNECREKIGFINENARVLHDQNYGLIDWTRKLPRFAILRAKEKMEFNSSRRVSAFEVFFTFVGTFFKIYLKSYKNGKIGIVISFTTAINRCLSKLIMYEKAEFGFEEKLAEKAKELD